MIIKKKRKMKQNGNVKLHNVKRKQISCREVIWRKAVNIGTNENIAKRGQTCNYLLKAE